LNHEQDKGSPNNNGDAVPEVNEGHDHKGQTGPCFFHQDLLPYLNVFINLKHNSVWKATTVQRKGSNITTFDCKRKKNDSLIPQK